MHRRIVFPGKLAPQSVSEYHADVTPLTGMLDISAHILHHLGMLQ